ncbi:perilipin-1 [Eudromia elegans]
MTARKNPALPPASAEGRVVVGCFLTAPGLGAQENVLRRVLQLPVVSSTCESLQRTYASTKEAHPLVASVCHVYERGVQGAGALAARGVRPVVRRLEPQLAVANELACRGLDHLQERIPALQYPVDKVAYDLKDTISYPLQSARKSISSTVDKVMEMAAEGYERTRSTVETTARYTRSNSVSQMAVAGMDTALGGLEKLMDYLLPEEDQAADRKPAGLRRSSAKPSQQRPRAPSAPSSPGALGRIGALVSTVSQRAYQQTAQGLRHAKTKGQELAAWIPVVEGEGAGLVGSVAQNLQTAYVSGISSVKKVPAVAWDAAEGLILFTPRRLSRAMETVDALGGTLVSAPKHLLGTLYSYVPLRRQSVKEDAAARGSKPGEAEREEEQDAKAAAPSSAERPPLKGDWRAYRGHHPFSYLGLEDPLFVRHNPYRSASSEPEFPPPRKSAFSPYSRRVSEGSYRFQPEAAYSRAYYAGLYGSAYKKD